VGPSKATRTRPVASAATARSPAPAAAPIAAVAKMDAAVVIPLMISPVGSGAAIRVAVSVAVSENHLR
jgi:hypothetical protein